MALLSRGVHECILSIDLTETYEKKNFSAENTIDSSDGNIIFFMKFYVTKFRKIFGES